MGDFEIVAAETFYSLGMFWLRFWVMKGLLLTQISQRSSACKTDFILVSKMKRRSKDVSGRIDPTTAPTEYDT